MNNFHRSLIAPLLIAAVALMAVAASAAVHFTHESLQAFRSQLNGGQVHAVTFNKKAHTVHVTLNDGRHVLASYPPKDQPALANQIKAKGISVKVTKRKAKPAAHHKLRYIAAGVLVVLILIVALVLGLNRRRPREAEGEPATETAAPVAPAATGATSARTQAGGASGAEPQERPRQPEPPQR